MKTIKYFLALAVLLTVSSCRTLEEFNESPNNVPVPTAQPYDMMDEIICNGALNVQQRFYDTFAEIMQYTVVSSSSNEVCHRYYIAPSYIDNCWNNMARWYVNADHMYDLAVRIEDKNYQAIAIVLRSMYMDWLSTVFGPVPCTEANQLREFDNNTPVFDTEKTVYCKLIEDLEYANTLFDSSKSLANSSKDKLFGGNVLKWQKFCNSLYLRVLMRLSLRNNEMEVALGESVANKIGKVIANPTKYPVMSSIEDNACVFFSGESPFQNNWGAYTESTLSGHRGAEHLIAQLAGKNDPRKWLWFTPWSASIQWMGVKSGYPGDDTASSGYPVYNFDLFMNYKLPVSFMNYDEVCFIIAEALATDAGDDWKAIPGNGSATLITKWYNDGVRASCEHWRNIYNTYLGNTGRFNTDSSYHYRNFAAVEATTVTFTAGSMKGTSITYEPVISDEAIDEFINVSSPIDISNPIKSIINQKFIASFRVFDESWNDYRRTGFPELEIGTGVYNNGILPRRLIYPTKTRETNIDNYNLNIDYLRDTYYDGRDDMLTPVWWSQAGLSMEKR